MLRYIREAAGQPLGSYSLLIPELNRPLPSSFPPHTVLCFQVRAVGFHAEDPFFKLL